MCLQGISEVLKEAGSATAEDLPDYSPQADRPLTVREVAVAKVAREVKEIKQMMADAKAARAAQDSSAIDDFVAKTKAMHAMAAATTTTPPVEPDSTSTSTTQP